MRRTLYIDIDSTIWPAEVEYDIAETEMYGSKLLSSDWYDIPELIRIFGENYKDIFWRALSPERVSNRRLYPHVAAALRSLYVMDLEFHFFTHNPFPDDMYEPLHDWLSRDLTVPFELTVKEEHNCKVAAMKDDPTAWGIVEDRHHTLFKAHAAGYHAFGMKQPWNRNFREPTVNWFDNWLDGLFTIGGKALADSLEAA